MEFVALGFNILAYVTACLTFPQQQLIPGPPLSRRWLWGAATFSALAFFLLCSKHTLTISACIYVLSLYLVASVFLVLALVPTMPTPTLPRTLSPQVNRSNPTPEMLCPYHD